MNDPGDSTLAVATAEASTDSEPPERLPVEVLHQAGDWSAFAAPEPAIETAAMAVASHPQSRWLDGAEASVILADDALIRSLNSTYRGKDKPTNVLSFPFQLPPGAPHKSILGDVVLSAETIQREAAERGIAPVHHLQHLVIHGLLHFLGFGHETDTEAEEMERLETDILATLGISDPHAPVAIE
jgi:probable rRNA maturation factor